MSFSQHLKFSNLTLIAGVFFASVILSACSGDDSSTAATTTTSEHIVTTPSYPTPAGLASFQTEAYGKSGALGDVKAAYGYGNIKAMVDAGASGVTQGGEGQIVSLFIDRGFNTKHQTFDADGTVDSAGAGDADAFSSYTLIDLGSITAYTPLAANCTDSLCTGAEIAAVIAGRKNGTEIHGVAYQAKIKAFKATAHISNEQVAVSAGVGADIVAMNYVTDHASIGVNTFVYNGDIRVCYNDNGTLRKYVRSVGINQGAETNNCDDYTDAEHQREDTRHFKGTSVVMFLGNTYKTDYDVLTPWVEAVDPNGPNKTVIVIPTGNHGFNSETGQVQDISQKDDIYISRGSKNDVERSALIITGSMEAANIPNLRSAYPALYDDDIEPGRWLAVSAVDEDNVMLPKANGCGVAWHFCLVAPGKDIYTARSRHNNDYLTRTDTEIASATVTGALAVIKGAFPNMTPEQLTQLVLETATYIPLDGKNPDGTPYPRISVRGYTYGEDFFHRIKIKTADGRARYINPVYGYGLLNLQAATSASVTSSYVTASNNTSIGALWKDTQLTLSSHFGSNFESVKFGIGDAYGRHFITAAPQTSYAPIAVSLDDYMANMLADNVQSETLGGQAKLNYSNSGQAWMNLEYRSGKATSKIAFQDNYKINPLNDSGATSILRANHIRPASNNIGMMDVDYKLSGALSLSSYAARGEYDTGYKFDELGTDFDVNYKDSHLNIAIGNIREHDQFLGTHTTGGYALNAPTVSRFTDVTYGHDVGAKFNIYANYINYETDVDMLHDQFASIDNLQADQYQVGFTGKSLISDDDNLNVALITKLGVTDGALNQNTTLGYTADGAFNDVSQSYDLAVSERHQQFEITYQGKIYQNSDKVSTLKDNRFFTTIRVDQNLNHVEGLGQTEIVSGVSARF